MVVTHKAVTMTVFLLGLFLLLVLLLLEQRLPRVCPPHNVPPLNILFRVPFPNMCLQQIHNSNSTLGPITQHAPGAI